MPISGIGWPTGDSNGPPGGLGYPVTTTVARAARDPDDRSRPEREQDGTPQ
jgi:hypothetical protein